MDFSNYKFHCSSLGKIMTESRTKEPLGETCKKHLLECYLYAKYGRRKMIENKYIEKGNLAEEDAITLYSLVTNTMYVKNTEIFENDFIVGIPDIIHKGKVKDIKNAWSIHTFFENMVTALNKDYVYQVNGYMALTESAEGSIVYTLVNTPDILIEQEKSKLRYKMGLIDPEANEVYLQAAAEIDRNCIFDDIPKEDRYMEFIVPVVDMDKIYSRVMECRTFLNQLK